MTRGRGAYAGTTSYAIVAHSRATSPSSWMKFDNQLESALFNVAFNPISKEVVIALGPAKSFSM
jgi:hypothetical protein